VHLEQLFSLNLKHRCRGSTLKSYGEILSQIAMALATVVAASPAYADGQAGEYEYPELLVTPSASKRLESEANAESSSRFTAFLPIQAGSTLVLAAGLLAVNDGPLARQDPADTPMAKWAGIGAISSGLGWLGITGTLSAIYSPYKGGWAEVKKMPASSKREQLMRERAAEERLQAPAGLARKIKWLSIFTNVSMSAFVISSSEDNVTRVAGLMGALGSLAPLIFESSWITSYETHEDYRKRIYGPISSIGIGRNPWTGAWSPSIGMTYHL
jgi:hypothetical protein